MKRSPMKRGTKGLKPGGPLKRGKPMRKQGRVGKLRQLGNRGARQHYFQEFGDPDAPGWAPCQACGRPMHHTDCDSHHKSKNGEDLTNKLACHASCHQGFIHDPQQPRNENRKQVHRLEAKESPVDVTTGGRVEWTKETQERLDAFKLGSVGCQDGPK